MFHRPFQFLSLCLDVLKMNDVCICCFPHCCNKIPNESNLREDACTQLEGTRPHGTEGVWVRMNPWMRAEAPGRGSHQEAERSMLVLTCLSLCPFVQFGIAHGRVPTAVRVIQ